MSSEILININQNIQKGQIKLLYLRTLTLQYCSILDNETDNRRC